MINKRLEALCEIVTEAHTLIQRDFKRVNPIVSVNQKMYENAQTALPRSDTTENFLNITGASLL